MTVKSITNQIISKNLSGREAASICLTSQIQSAYGLEETFSKAEAQNAFVNIKGNPKERRSFIKWMSIESIMPCLANAANSNALGAVGQLKYILLKLERIKFMWLLEGCEEHWFALVEKKMAMFKEAGCQDSIAELIGYSNFTDRNLQSESDVIRECYLTALKKIALYQKSKMLCELVKELVNVDMSIAVLPNELVIKAGINLFNAFIQEIMILNDSLKDNDKIRKILCNGEIDFINMDDYLPSGEFVEETKQAIINADVYEIMEVFGGVFGASGS